MLDLCWDGWLDDTRLFPILLILAAIVVIAVFLHGRSGRRPKIVGNGFLKHKLLQACPILHQRYWPTFWAFNGHVMTIMRVALQIHPAIAYHRDILVLNDGGEVALDWGIMKNSKEKLSSYLLRTEQRGLPVLLIVPGLTGDSSDSYIEHIVEGALQGGYRPIVFNQRGLGGIKLKTLRTYCGTNIEDLVEVIQYIKRCFPTARVFGIGLSYGGTLLVQYLYQLRMKCDLAAVIACGAVWEPFKTRDTIERKWCSRLLYSRRITNKLKTLTKRNISHMTAEELDNFPLDLKGIFKAKVISEFDTHVTIKLFGYSSVEDYYTALYLKDKVHLIQTPLVSLHAEDDPFIPKDALPVEEFGCNPYTVMIVTAHGGHFGYIEGVYPNKKTWMDRTVSQLLEAFKTVL